MNAALVFTYTRPAAGREALGMEAFVDSLTFFGKLAADDKTSEPMLYMSPASGSMMIIHGDGEFLHELIHTDDFMAMFMKASFSVPDIEYEIWDLGERVEQTIAIWGAKGAEFGLM